MKPPLTLAVEQQLWEKNVSIVVGTDEVGRGALAGPVVAASVVLHPETLRETWWREVRDSKQLSAGKREELSAIIAERAMAYSVRAVEQSVIDEINILQASLLAMRQAVEDAVTRVASLPDVASVQVLVDGKVKVPGLTVPQTTLVAGDSYVVSIAAASILAKVYRDNLMAELDAVYPGYGFTAHKGYGTKAHFAALHERGLSAVHRRSFCGTIPTLS
jgi:ribonuclease HII